MEYAENEFKLERRTEGAKGTLREHLRQVHKSTGKLPERLERSNRKPKMMYLWLAYLELLQVRPLTYLELSKWSEMTGRSLTPVEIGLLMEIDRVNPFPIPHHG